MFYSDSDAAALSFCSHQKWRLLCCCDGQSGMHSLIGAAAPVFLCFQQKVMNITILYMEEART